MGIMEKKMEITYTGLYIYIYIEGIEHRVYGDLVLTCPKPCSIYLRGTVGCCVLGF